jgi:hypothetical protein
VTDFIRQLYSGVDQPADLLQAINTWSTAPIPKYAPIAKLIVNDEKLSRQLIADGLNAKDNLHEMEFLPIEYAHGRANLKKMGKDKGLPEARELMAKSANQSHDYIEALYKTCDLEAFNSQVQRLKNYFNEGR